MPHNTVTQIFDEMAAKNSPLLQVPNVSSWNSPKYDVILKRCFKTYRRVLPCDEYISHTLFGGREFELNHEALGSILNYLDKVVRINTDEETFFRMNLNMKLTKYIATVQDVEKNTNDIFHLKDAEYIAVNRM